MLLLVMLLMNHNNISSHHLSHTIHRNHHSNNDNNIMILTITYAEVMSEIGRKEGITTDQLSYSTFRTLAYISLEKGELLYPYLPTILHNAIVLYNAESDARAVAITMVCISVLIVDCWLLIIVDWLLIVDCWLLIVDCWLLIVDCWLIVGWLYCIRIYQQYFAMELCCMMSVLMPHYGMVIVVACWLLPFDWLLIVDYWIIDIDCWLIVDWFDFWLLVHLLHDYFLPHVCVCVLSLQRWLCCVLLTYLAYLSVDCYWCWILLCFCS